MELMKPDDPNYNKKLTETAKQALSRLVEKTYKDATALHSSAADKVRAKALEEYIKKVGAKKIQKQIRSLNEAICDLKEKLSDLGLTMDYSKELTSTHDGPATEYINAKVQAAIKPLQSCSAIQAKIWGSSTNGEAMGWVGMALGNGAPPQVVLDAVEDATLIEYKSE